MRLRALHALVPAAVLLAAGAAQGLVHVLIPGQKAFGTISQAGEVDRVYFQAQAGRKLTFVLKARKGETLLPVFLGLEDPAQSDVLGILAEAKTNRKGNVTKLKFVPPQGGTWSLSFSGADGSTGTWDLSSKGPGKVPLGAASIAAPGAEVPHEFDADVGTVATIQAKASPGSLLRPFLLRVDRPGGAGELDTSAAKRSTRRRSDTLKSLPLPDNGTWTVTVTGAEGTTGAYALTLKVAKKVPLDFTTDFPDVPPPPPAPAVSSVDPSSMTVPLAGSRAESIAVSGTGFVNGATTSITAEAGTNGIAGVSTSFVSATALTVNFTLSSTATPGLRDVTVTNPDMQSGTGAGVLALDPPPITTVASVTPSTGSGEGGFQALVQGDLFQAGAAVTFGGIPARAVNVIDARNVLCVVPPAAAVSRTAGTPVDVRVDNGGGDAATLSGGFTYDADADPPTVSSTVPAGGATGVARNLLDYVFVLSGRASPSSVSSALGFDFFGTPVQDVPDLPSSVALGPGNRHVVMRRGTPPANLTGSNGYRANIPVSVTDVAGNALDPAPFGGPVFQGSLTTHAAATDAVAPGVASTVPAVGSVTGPVDQPLLVNFTEPVDPSTVAGAVTLVRGATPVPFDLGLDDACTTATILPRRRLDFGTGYTIGVGTGVRDLFGNSLAVAFNALFTTAAVDGTAPSQVLTVDLLPQDMNGSGTYVTGISNPPTPPGGTAAYNAYLPRSGFTVDVAFADAGGSGIDPASFSCTCSAQMGTVPPFTELAGFFTVNALGARWTVDAGHALAVGTGITFTVNVSDYAGNAAPARSLAVDVADLSRQINGSPGNAGNDRDPFNARQSWLLRFDQDLWTLTVTGATPNYETPAHSRPVTVLSAASSNGTPDFREDLQALGLNGTESAAGAATVTNGSDTGTNAIVQTMVQRAVRGHLNERYGIAFDGVRGADAVDVEFLLAGETKSGGGTVGPAGWTPSSGFSMMTFTGDERAVDGTATGVGGTIGRAAFDLRNTVEDDDSNTAASDGSNLGVFATHIVRLEMNGSEGSAFARTFDPLIPLAGRGGTPVGASALDAVVLAGSFDYAGATAAQRARFDLIATAVDRWALQLSLTGAHEIGHSTGLVSDGAPPLGLFGNAHPNNTFVASMAFTTPGHLDTAGNNVMAAASSFDEAIAGGSSFSRFNPLALAWLLRRFVYDQ